MLSRTPRKLPGLQFVLALFITIDCASVAVFADPPATQPASNYGPVLNTNGGFEEGLGNYHRTQPTASFIDTDQVYRGQYSLRLQGTGTGQGSANIVVTGGIACVRGKKYLYRFAYKAQNVGTDSQAFPSFTIVAGTEKQGEQKYPGTVFIKEDGDWKIQEMTVQISEGIKHIGFWMFVPNTSKATVWFDEVEIREVLN